MKYAIDYRSMHTGIHGLIIFNDIDLADEAYGVLKNEEEEDVESVYDYVFNILAYNVVDEINCRDIKEYMEDVKTFVNYNGRVSTELVDLQVINCGNSIDLYGV